MTNTTQTQRKAGRPRLAPLSEAQLVPYVLAFLGKNDNATVTQIKKGVRKMLAGKLHKNDLTLIEGKTTRFEKTIGNMFSHKAISSLIHKTPNLFESRSTSYTLNNRGRELASKLAV